LQLQQVAAHTGGEGDVVDSHDNSPFWGCVMWPSGLSVCIVAYVFYFNIFSPQVKKQLKLWRRPLFAALNYGSCSCAHARKGRLQLTGKGRMSHQG